MEPLFSIVTVTRNHCGGLCDTGRSVRAQTFCNYEWIVIDGASTDGTAVKAADLAPDVFVSEPDTGLYQAMNKGLARAKGAFVWFLNAGDALAHDGVLANLAEAVARAPHPPDFIHGHASEEGRCWPSFPAHHIRWRMIGSHQAMLYRRKRIHTPYDENLRIAGDYVFTRCFIGQPDIVSLPCDAVLAACEKRGLSAQHARCGRREEWEFRRIHDGPFLAGCIYIRQWVGGMLSACAPSLFAWARARVARWTARA